MIESPHGLPGVHLYCFPTDVPRSWEAFVASSFSYSIALDGYVIGGPKFNSDLPAANFNHHEEVDRLATRATCAQVLVSIRQGLFNIFRDSGQPTAYVYTNDCDEDVCTSWFLLSNHVLCEQAINPRINRLVFMEDMLDATAGAYPFPKDLPILKELSWVFEPYRQFRLSGQLGNKDHKAYRSVIVDVTGRISKHVMGEGDKISLDTRYERVGGGDGWALIREIGAQARTGMYSDGIRAFVSYRERQVGRGEKPRYDYVVGRMSPFIPFACDRLYGACNAIDDAKDDKWGGSDTIGGSPRVGGSGIDPDMMCKIVEKITVRK